LTYLHHGFGVGGHRVCPQTKGTAKFSLIKMVPTSRPSSVVAGRRSLRTGPTRADDELEVQLARAHREVGESPCHLARAPPRRLRGESQAR